MKLYNINFISDLSVNENVILALLFYKREEKINEKIISKCFNLSVRTIQRVISSLITKGYLERRIIGKNADKLSYKHVLTKKTIELYSYVKNDYKPKKPAKKVVETPEWYEDYKKQLEEKTKNEERTNATYNYDEIKAFFEE